MTCSGNSFIENLQAAFSRERSDIVRWMLDFIEQIAATEIPKLERDGALCLYRNQVNFFFQEAMVYILDQIEEHEQGDKKRLRACFDRIPRDEMRWHFINNFDAKMKTIYGNDGRYKRSAFSAAPDPSLGL